jgi:hypothetical protein
MVRMRVAITVAAIMVCLGAVASEVPAPSARQEVSEEDPEAASARRTAARPHLVVEYLPALVYYRERIALRLRVENPRGEPLACSVEARLWPPEDDAKTDPPEVIALDVPARGSESAAFDLPSTGWMRAEVVLSTGEGPQDSFGARRFDEGSMLPPLEAGGERLYLRGGLEAVVLCLRQRTGRPDREWYLVGRLARSFEKGTEPAGVLCLGARLSEAGPGEDDPPYMRALGERAGTWVETTVLPGESARGVLHPILADLALSLAAVEAARPAEVVVWVVACDDARRATPTRTFRKSADLLLSRVRRKGAARIEVVFCPEPAVPAGRRAVYLEELSAACLAYRAGLTVVEGFEEGRSWTAPRGAPGPPSTSRGAVKGEAGPRALQQHAAVRALLRHPNARGHEALAEAVLSRLRP